MEKRDVATGGYTLVFWVLKRLTKIDGELAL